jgi:hypothetical protein
MPLANHGGGSRAARSSVCQADCSGGSLGDEHHQDWLVNDHAPANIPSKADYVFDKQ